MIYAYIFVMAGVTYLIRMLPLTLFQKKITNVYIRSFLYYVPYVTLSVMTFPAIMNTTGSTVIGLLALLAGIVSSWIGLGLFPVSIICCLTVFIAEII